MGKHLKNAEMSQCKPRHPKSHKTSTRREAASVKLDSEIIKEAAKAKSSPPSAGFPSLNQN